ncbi:NAD(P)H dehydrogenase (quinone) [Kibdelosporangium banguiense]|uniref:NAD(P)H dehydrogenase (Quinone) n=1 Tax=Kibdelosporangium banguiense TaxID=1365924 RepID=A0ABS4T9K1_9PSEU|nr:NAD(P)H-binding protein [Kibdelosporangium banguiense]MBP2321100.1 NAD(P)H dehydrogenase (quinone) [Kibdelosporangium banguiense]
MTTLLTGATGQLGGLTAKHLRERADFVVSVRDPAKAADLGVEVRQGDFTDPDGLAKTFAGVDKLVLVSVDGPDELRIKIHANAVAAAQRAGVQHIIYTSVSDAATSPLGLAKVHKATEEAIRATGIAYTFLRNGMYHENYTGQLAQALPLGAFLTSAATGKIATVARDDLALAAAIVAATDGHENKIYELTGAQAWTFDEFAALVAEATGKPFVHQNIPAAELTAIYVGAGLPDFLAEVLTDIYVNIGHGVLADVRPDLEKLIGRPASPLAHAIREAVTS